MAATMSFTTKMRLYLAGWRPRRDVWERLRLPASLAVFPEAKRILSSFGGLRFGNRNEHVVFDPSDAVADDTELVWRCEKAVGRRLYPIGYQEHQDREPILVDEGGAVYMNFGDRLYVVAGTFEKVVKTLARAGQAKALEVPPLGSGLTETSWFVGDTVRP